MSINAITGWFGALQPRERIMVTAAGAFVLVVAGFLLLVEPLQKNRDQAHRRAISALHLEQRVISAQKLIGSSDSQAGGEVYPGPLLTLMNASTTAHRIAAQVKRISPQGDNKVQVNFAETGFNALLGWIAELENQQRLTVTSLTMQPGSEPGTVSATISLQR